MSGHRQCCCSNGDPNTQQLTRRLVSPKQKDAWPAAFTFLGRPGRQPHLQGPWAGPALATAIMPLSTQWRWEGSVRQSQGSSSGSCTHPCTNIPLVQV